MRAARAWHILWAMPEDLVIPVPAEKTMRSDKTPGEKVYIALPVPDNIAVGWPDDPKVGRPHITILYVGTVVPERKTEFLGLILEVAANAAPFEVAFAPGLAWFTNQDGDEIAHKSFVPDGAALLAGLHALLRSALQNAGFALEHIDGIFIPHATLAYRRERGYIGPVPEGGWRIEAIEIWGWPEDYVIHLGGAPAEKEPIRPAPEPPSTSWTAWKFAEERQEATGVLAKAFDGTAASLDGDGEALRAADVLQLARSYMLRGKIGGHDDNHDRLPHNRRLVEIFVNDERVASPLFPAGACVVTMQYPDPEDWQLVRSGQRSGFSFDADTIPVVATVELLVDPEQVIQ